ncbi:MerR family transcriptional regulator [Rhizobium laguerreae]|uniref:chaperone modulator CbpM n=1 Tax=Rhizobium laguerreae TaxID=1076926 RepID=UPI001C909D4C|nr:chaperone modulator CbpM [Rhizobium laguerreae]MBY3088626.1 MerR family transcriptional regulator [Rhizobium laguerreae]MBY3150554.1 MerR family transcriptional regulator [Rhizobium laguerreae]
MDDHEFRHRLKIEVTELELWIQEGWLQPQTHEDQRQFRDADLARARLILDLTNGMGVNEAGIDVIMDLVDQLHGLRMVMRDLISAVGSEDPTVKQRLRAALDKDFDARSL